MRCLFMNGFPLKSCFGAEVSEFKVAGEYFTLGEDIAARVMFFMLYQMLSYTDRVVQSDVTKQKLNYFFVRFGAAGMVLSMLDANN